MDEINRIDIPEELCWYILKYFTTRARINHEIESEVITWEYKPYLTYASWSHNNEVYRFYIYFKGLLYFELEKDHVEDGQKLYDDHLYSNAYSRQQLKTILTNFTREVPFNQMLIDSLCDNYGINEFHYVCYRTLWIDPKGNITGKETRTCPQVPTNLNSGGYGEYEHVKLYSMDKYNRICVSIEEIPLLVPKIDTNIKKIDSDLRFKNYEFYEKMHKKVFRIKSKTKNKY